jgi:hypothetical protein
MEADDRPDQADDAQLELLESLIARARAQGIRTGARSEELHELDRDSATELIEQLQRRLGDISG